MTSADQQLRLLQAELELLAWEWDISDGNLVCSGLPRFLGFDALPENVLLQDFRSRQIHPEDMPRVEKAWRNYLAGEAINYSCEFRYLDANSKVVWVRETGEFPEDLTQPKLVGISRKTLPRMQALVESVASRQAVNGLLVCGIDGNIQ